MMQTKRSLLALALRLGLLCVVMLGLTPSVGFAQSCEFVRESFCTLHGLDGNLDGSHPLAGVVQGTDGNFYGVTQDGGAHGAGVIFRVNRIDDGHGAITFSFDRLYSFDGLTDGGNPWGVLMESSPGVFFGTTICGGGAGTDCFDSAHPLNLGSGTIFKFDTNTSPGTFTTVYAFTGDFDGTSPYAGLVRGRDGLFYGTTFCGGTATNCLDNTGTVDNGGGTIFKYDATQNTGTHGLTTLRTLASSGPDGCTPLASLVQGKGSDTSFYGTTGYCGPNNWGTIFRINGTTFTRLHSFTNLADGGAPAASLVQAPNGSFYGTALYGGVAGLGTLFQFDAGVDESTSTLTVLHSFAGGLDGGNPYVGSLILARDGSLYGTTYDISNDPLATGTIFRIDPNTRAFTTLYTFTGGLDGKNPAGGLVQGRAPDFSLYGTTFLGPFLSTDAGAGLIYQFFPPPVLACPASVVTTATKPAGADVTLNHSSALVLSSVIDPSNTPTTITWSDGGLPIHVDVVTGPFFDPMTGAPIAIPIALTSTFSAGIHTVTILAVDGYVPALTASCTLTVEVDKLDQTVDFQPMADRTFGAAPFALAATAPQSHLPVTFSIVSGPGTLVGNLLTMTGGGTITIKASQAGDGQYNPATATQTVTVQPAAQTITFTAVPTQTFPGPSVVLVATATSGLPVTFSIGAGSPGTLLGNVLTTTGAGTIVLTASQGGNNSYLAAPDVPQNVVVKLNQTITFPTVGAQAFGVAPIALNATASSNLAVSYAVAAGDPGSIVNGVLTITGIGTIHITASQAGNLTTYNAAPDVTQTVVVSKGNQTITFPSVGALTFGTLPVNLTATASSGLAVSYAVAAGDPGSILNGVLTVTGAGTIHITASQGGNANYNAATPVPQTVNVAKKNQTITFPSVGALTFGTLPVNLTATASSGLTVSYAVGAGDPGSILNGVLTVTGAGTINITASQPGDTNYNVATSVLQVVTVAKKNQTITFPTVGAQAFGVAPIVLNATASSNLAVSYAVAAGDPGSILNGVLTITGLGTIHITASQPGDANYNAATPSAQNVVVSKGNQTITFANPGPLTYGTSPVTLGATSTSGLTVAYTVASGPGTIPTNSNQLTITGVGTIVINANQSGNANFNAAPQVQQSVVVGKGSQTITFNAPPSQALGAGVGLVASSTSGLAVTFTVVSGGTGQGTLSGANNGTLTGTALGTVFVKASQSGNANYNAAADVQQTVTIGKANQTISFTTVPAQVFGATVNLVASATSGLSVSFVVTSGPGTITNGNQLTTTGVGSIVVTASQAGNTSYNAAPDVPQTIAVGKASQTINFPAPTVPTVGGPAVTLSATATSGLPVTTFTLVSGPATLLGNQLTATGGGTIVVKASQAGNANYNAAPDATQNIIVGKASQTITFTEVPVQTYGNSPVTLTASASSGLPVSFTVVSGPGTIPANSNVLTITGAGTIAVKASQAGNTQYNAAPDVSRNVTVNKKALTITTVSTSRNYGLANPAFTVSYAGFVLGQGASALQGSLTFTTSATTTSNPGTYSVTPAGLTSANYAIAFVAGTLTVLDIPPVAANDVATTSTGTAVTVPVLANDAHAVGTLTITSVTTPAHGTAAISGQSIVYTPASGYTGSDSFSYTENDGFGGTSTGTVTLTVGSAVSPLGRFVAFSKDLTWLHEGATVTTGDIGANLSRGHDDGDDNDHHHGDDDGHDHWSGNGHGDDDDDDSVTVRLDTNAVMQQASSRVVGDTVELGSHASIYGLVKNSLVNHGATILGTTVNTMAVPYLTLPVFPSISTGTTTVTVNANTTKTLAAGNYGAIHVYGGGKLILTGGLYQIVSLDVDQSGIVMFKAAVDLRIKTSLNADTSSQIVTDPTVSGLKASQVKIYVAGADDDGGCHNRDQDSSDNGFGGEVVVNIGERAIVKANIYAPNGTVWLKSRSQGTGAFIGEHVQVGPSATLTLDSGF